VGSDDALLYPNYGEQIKQWTNVFGLSQDPTTTTESDPEANYTKTTYGDKVVGYSAEGVGHTVPVHASIDLEWFGLL
jgi:acetylxylan esterase